jgi:hypothetical protein
MAENKIDEDVQDVRNQLILGNRHLSIPLSRFGFDKSWGSRRQTG